MKIKMIFLYIFTTLSVLTISCRKTKNNADTFQDETQQGKNTLGCYIDGKPFISGTTLFGLVSPVNVNYYKDSVPFLYRAGFLAVGGIDARYSLDLAGDIVINKLNIFAVGEYPLVSQGGVCSQNYSCDDIGYYNAKTGKTYFAQSGKLTLTKLDTLNKIVSGRFYFTAKDTLGNKIEVTNGRFDAKYLN